MIIMGGEKTAFLSAPERKALNKLVSVFPFDGDIHGSLSLLKCISVLKVEFVLGFKAPSWRLLRVRENALKELVGFFDAVEIEPVEVEGSKPLLKVSADLWL